MLKTLLTAWKLPEIRKKLLFTLLLIVIFRFGAYVPIPGVNPAYIQQQAMMYDIFGYIDMITGGSFSNFTVLALGISPYITSSIIIQLLTIAIPALERMQKEGELGRKKLERLTRVIGVVFSFVTAFGYVYAMGEGVFLPSNIIPKAISYITVGLVLTAGSTFLIWLSEVITEIGIGNGSSFIIFVGIISRLPDTAMNLGREVLAGTRGWWLIPIILVVALLIFVAVIFIDLGERKIPVQYAKRVVGRKMYGGQSTFIPIRVNANGVMPLIFAMTLVQLPQMIAQFWPNSGFAEGVKNYFSSGTIVYFVVYTLLIIAFAYFYSMISFNPIELSKNMQAQGGFIPGIRPGKPTSDYLSRISSRLTLVSAIFLALLATVPTFASRWLPELASFGATSLLITVSVALETNKQLQAQISMRHYKGFLK